MQSELRQPELAFVCAASERAEAALHGACARHTARLPASADTDLRASIALLVLVGRVQAEGVVGAAAHARHALDARGLGAAWRPRQATGGGVLQRADGRATRQRAPSHAVGATPSRPALQRRPPAAAADPPRGARLLGFALRIKAQSRATGDGALPTATPARENANADAGVGPGT